MIVKILGAIDIIAGLILILLSFSVSIPSNIIIIVGAVIGIKGLFILTKNLVSLMDLAAAAVLFLSLIITIPNAVLLIAAFLVLQKGFLSFL